MIGGFSVSPTYRFGAGAGFRAPDDAREDDAFAGARPFLVGLVLLAMPPRYGGGAGNARNDAAAGIRPHRVLTRRATDQRRRLTIVSRPIPLWVTAKPSLRYSVTAKLPRSTLRHRRA